jgi:dipeptidyl-peptidase-4
MSRRPARRAPLAPARAALLLALAWTPTLHGQGTRSDYERAVRFLGTYATPLVAHDQVQPNWIDGDRFWYRVRTAEGHAFVLVDPAANVQRPAFDHARLAAALSLAADTAYTPTHLPFDRIALTPDGRSVGFETPGRRGWRCDLVAYTCTRAEPPARPGPGEAFSPDGRRIAFLRDGNLWVRERDTGEETQLTDDAVPYHRYGEHYEGCCRAISNRRPGAEPRPIAMWSPDGRRIATWRIDERDVPELALLETAEPRPILHTFRYALPGDTAVPMFDVHLFDVERRSHVRVQREPQHVRSSSCCGMTRDTLWADTQWSRDGSRFWFGSTSRDYRHFELFEADAATGAVRKLLEERVATFYESNLRSGGVPNWRLINDGRDLIWFSQRDGWGHLYRYDAATGTLRNRITSGAWAVGDILHIDEAGGWLYFTAHGREPGRDPYHRLLYRVRLDGSGMALLTPEDADHELHVSPSGRWLVDTYSRADTLPVTVLRRIDGTVVRTLERADASRLFALGWTYPERVVVKARDGVTDLYGLVYRPATFDPAAKYPVIVYNYPGPQTGSIGSRAFTASSRGNARSLAELGFIVVKIDALGTPLRSKAFMDAWYGNMADGGLADQVAGLRQLAVRYPEMDLERVGIYGHSGGGFSSASAILRYPDFFKVAVSSAGNHDNRGYTYYWGEKYQGLLVADTLRGTDNYASQANHLLAGNLKGRLLLMYGTLDENVHPNMTLLLIDALIRHDRDFDVLVLPNRTHGFANEPYVVRRTWDYFVRHLLGVEPPADVRLTDPR